MNKPPQPIGAPPPAPSPSLPQAAFAPGHPPNVLFAAPPPPQMNTAPPPRQFSVGPRALSQQPYYQPRPGPAPSGTPRPVGPTRVFQPGAPMVMISQQQLPFANSQSPAYFIQPGQYRTAYVPPPQQYPMTSGTPGFYPVTSAAEYEPPLPPGGRGGVGRGGGRENGPRGARGPPLGARRLAGTYYPAPPQYSVTSVPAVLSPAPPQPAPAPTPPPPQGHSKRERKQIRIRDPNQGGRDVTEEIMSGARSTSTPTPPHCAGAEGEGPIQTNGECDPPADPAQHGPGVGEDSVTPSTEPLSPSRSPKPAPSTPPADLSDHARDNQASTPADELITPEDTAERYSTPPLSNSPSDSADVSDPAPEPVPTGIPADERPVTAATAEQAPVPMVEEEGEELGESDPPVAVAVADANPGPAPCSTSSPSTDPPPALTNGTAADTPPPEPHAAPEPLPSEPLELRLPNGLGPPRVATETTPTHAEMALHPPPEAEEGPAPDGMAPPAEGRPEQVAFPKEEEQEELNKDEQVRGDLELSKEEPAVQGPSELEPFQADVSQCCPATPNMEPSSATPNVEAGLATPNMEPSPATPNMEPGLATPNMEPSPVTPNMESSPATPNMESSPATPNMESSPAIPNMEPGPATPNMESGPATPNMEQGPATPNMEAGLATPNMEPSAATPNMEPGPATPSMEPSPATPNMEPRPASPKMEPGPATPTEEPRPVAPAGEPDEEGKQDSGRTLKPEAPKSGDQKYQYKREEWKPIDQEEKKRYDREFLLGFQFAGVSMNKPEGLPHISDVVLDKAHRTTVRPLDPARMASVTCGPDFTPSFANLGRQPMGGRAPPPRSQHSQRKEPRKIIASVSLTEDVKLNRAENAWRPSGRKGATPGDGGAEDPESARTQELLRQVRSILNKLTPQMFQPLMRQVSELPIDSEERLKGVIDLVFEKAVSEPNFSVAYANMCRCLTGLKVPTTDKPSLTVNFRKLLLNRCQMEFEKDKDNDQIFELKQREMEAAATEEERQRLKEELELDRDKARRRSLGNIKFIGELFKLKMLTEAIMHDCVVKLLKNHDDESLECLCRLLSTIGKDLDFQKAKPRMDQYFTQMGKIIKEKKTSSRIRFMLQDVLDLRLNSWVPRRGDQGPKTIDQIHKEAELEEQREQVKVQQQLLSRKDTRGGGPVGGVRGGPHASGGRGPQPQDEGWNTVPISTKNRPIDTNRLSKITKPGALDFNNQLLAPGGKGTWGSWGKGSSGGSGSKPSGEAAPEPGRPATSTLNRFSALQQTPSAPRSAEHDRRTPQRNSSSRDRGDRGDRDRGDRFERPDRPDRSERQRLPLTKRSYGREAEQGGARDTPRRGASASDERGGPDRGSRDRGSRDRGSRDRASRDRGNRERGSKDRVNLDQASSREMVRREMGPPAAPPPAPAAPPKTALTEEEVERKSKAIIEEFLHINEMKEALQCVQELGATPLLSVFVRTAIESTLERSSIARQHMGLLLQQLLKTGTLPVAQYYTGLQEILEVAEDMAIDIPHIWLYLAEIITPMLHEGGIPMGQLFREVSKPLIPLGKAAVLLVEVLLLLCNGMSHKKAGVLWREAGLNWRDFLPEDEDVNKFVTDKKVEFTLGDDSVKPSRKGLSPEELQQHLDKLIRESADNQRVFDWVEANLDEQQASSNLLVRALMTSVCQSAVTGESPYKVDAERLVPRARLLQKYLTDEQKELQALYALQALMVKMEQPANLLRMFFDMLYDEDVIKEEAFYKWESSKDPAEQQGKGVALKSVTAFFTWLREAEEESDNS